MNGSPNFSASIIKLGINQAKIFRYLYEFSQCILWLSIFKYFEITEMTD